MQALDQTVSEQDFSGSPDRPQDAAQGIDRGFQRAGSFRRVESIDEDGPSQGKRRPEDRIAFQFLLADPHEIAL